jgi:hypothetical protein
MIVAPLHVSNLSRVFKTATGEPRESPRFLRASAINATGTPEALFGDASS